MSKIDKNKVVNNKLKKIVKLDLQKKLFIGKKNNNIFETFETKGSNLQMTHDITSHMFDIATGKVKKWGKILAIGAVCCVVVVNAISSCISTVSGLTSEVTPELPVEDVESLKQAMRNLDQATGKRLYQDFTITGENEDWKAVLSLLIGYHKNDLSNFAESLSGSGGNWQEGLISIDGLNFIKTHEGFSSVPYNIGDGTMTIGYGTTQKYEPEAYRQLAPRCTEPQASAVMERNIRQNYASTVLFYVNRSGRDLSDFKQHHFDALVSFQYNEGSIQDEVFWRMFKNGASYEAVANRMATTKISYGGGVVTRRKAEAKLFSTGYYPPVNIYDYGAGKPIVTSGSNMTGVSNSNLSKFYNAINEVSSDHKTLKRKSFKEALNNVGLDDEQKEIAEFLYEMDSWEVIFGEGFDFSFNLNGTYLSGGILGDYAGLSVPRQEILSIAQQICDLNLAYLFGGREYNLNKPINEINRVDCSGYTGYIMAKVFGAT